MKRKKIASLFKQVGSIYSQKDYTLSVIRKLKQCLNTTLQIVKVIGVLYASVDVVMLFTPIIAYIVLDEKILLLEYKIPFIDFDSNQGYVIHTVYHLFVIFIGMDLNTLRTTNIIHVFIIPGTIALYAFDLLLVFLVLMIYPCIYVVKDTLDQICRNVEVEDFSNDTNDDLVMQKYIDVIKFHKFIIRYD